MSDAGINSTTDASGTKTCAGGQDRLAHGQHALGEPVPHSYRFAHIEATWEGAGRFAAQWLPPLSGSADSRWMICNAHRLIQAVLLHVRMTYAPRDQHLYTVRALLEAEAEYPGSLFAVMLQSTETHVVQEVRRTQEHQTDPWFGGLSQALLCVRPW